MSNTPRTINIVIAALGGEGGGVLANWLTDVANCQGYLAQSTSVPGVAQRTGATIYYIELFPQSACTDSQPVMSLFPMQGDIDIVIASEMIEAGRMILRGFVTPQRTTLITSSHRVYAIGEKLIAGNGIVNSDTIHTIARAQSRRFIQADMQALALKHNTVISASLFGAIAASAVLPFGKPAFEQVIRDTGKAVNANLAAFSAAFEQISASAKASAVTTFTPTSDMSGTAPPVYAGATPSERKVFTLPAPTTSAGKQLLGRIADEFNEHCHEFLYLGVSRLLSYQDSAYANAYLDHLHTINQCSNDNSGELLRETARYLALWMAYEDIIRVAQIKISAGRCERFAQQANITPDQHYHIVEFLRPQMEDYVSIFPTAIAEKMLASPFWQKLLSYFTKGKCVTTSKLSGFLPFYALTWLKPLRPRSRGFQHEQTRIKQWLDAINHYMTHNYALAVELAKCGRLIKGYGATRKRSHDYMAAIMSLLEQGKIHHATQLADLRDSALNETGKEKFFERVNTLMQASSVD